MSRLRQWLTPEQPLQALSQAPARPVMCGGFRLYVLGIDAVSRALLDAQTRQDAYLRLRDRLFPNLCVRLDGNDIEELSGDASDLLLTRVASVRWLAAARRTPADVDFGFLYSPFAIAVDGNCLISGWVVPAASAAAFPQARLHASLQRQRVLLQVLPGPLSAEQPAQLLRQARA